MHNQGHVPDSVEPMHTEHSRGMPSLLGVLLERSSAR